jgi:hypothetical protein
MTTRTCTQCGHPLPEQAQFCGQCGALTSVPSVLTRTMLHAPAVAPAAAPATPSIEAGPAPPAPPPPTPVQPPPPKTAPVQADFKRTMLGFGAAVPAPAASPAPPAAPASPAAPAAAPALAQKAPLAAKKPGSTLGATMVGIAPPARMDASAVPPAAPEAAPKIAASKTMLGVAIPGIAPLRAGDATAAPPAQTMRRREDLPRGVDAPLPPVVPAPAPITDLPAPPPPRIVRRGGVPLAAVALVAGGLVVVGGAAIAYFWHGAPPITATPRMSPEGNDVLHLTCDAASCKDGTVVTVDGASAKFATGVADLPLTRALHVGPNPLSLHVDRPGMGRDEVIALTVPVAYRVRADVSAMNGPHPSVQIHVEALAGSDVRVADTAVTLDAQGAGTFAIDESAATEGPADESRVVALDVPYTVASGGRPSEAGTVRARVSVAPLRVDAPGARAVVDADQILLAGRAAKGATVTVDGAPATVSADGTFEKSVPLPAPAEVSVEVRSGTASLAPRTVHVALKRVASLADEAKAFEKQATLGYDAALANLATDAGRPIVVDGEVVEPRASGHRTLLLVDDRRGCAKGPCLARVVVGQEVVVARGDRLRAYGRVARAFATPTGETVPEIEADFVLRPKR